MNTNAVKVKVYENAIKDRINSILEYSDISLGGEVPVLDGRLEELIKLDNQVNFMMIVVDSAMHCIGLDYAEPYRRKGKLYYRPYRNYYSCDVGNPYWKNLVELGNADFKEDESSRYNATTFWLTRKGLDWLGELLGVTIYDSE